MNFNPRISFIGAGSMTRSLIGGLLRRDFVGADICAADPDARQRETLQQQFGVMTTTDNLHAIADASVVVFAIRQPEMRAATQALAAALARTRPLIVSVAAGIREPDIRRWLGYDAAIVRVMPNTPALIGEGAAALYANRFVTVEQRACVECMLKSVGLALWVDDENHMNAVTAVSGCGPAYFFLVMEAMETAGRKLGLAPELARAVVLQTAYGATRMARESGAAPADLRRQVASPGGTTFAALNVLEKAGMHELFLQALTAARDRGVELAREFGGDAP